MHRSTIGTLLLLGALATPATADEDKPVYSPWPSDSHATLRHETLRQERPAISLDKPVHFYDIAFGVADHKDSPENLHGLRHTHSLGIREINRAKHTIDNAVGLTIHTLSAHTSFGESRLNRLGALLVLTGTISATSHWAHEDAGHYLSYGGGALLRSAEERFLDRPTYALLSDRIAGGLNESENHFFHNLHDAHRTKLTLNNAISSIAAKSDSLIQWIYSYHFAPDSRGQLPRLKLDDEAPPGTITIIGPGDNRAYVAILEQVDGATKEKDLAASLVSALVNPHIWQSFALPIQYLIDGTLTQDIWELPLGPVGFRPPSIGIYRLPYGYYGRLSGSVRIDDLVIGYDYGRGLPRVGGDETRQHFGLNLNNIELGPLQIGIGGYLVQGTPNGYGGFAEVAIESDHIQFYARYEYDNNSVFNRPGYPDEQSFFTFGIRVNPD